MKGIKYFTGVIFFGLILSLAGCQKQTEQKQKNKIVRINIGQDISTFDPRKARDLNSIAVMKMLYDGLTRLNGIGQAELALAKSYEVSEDLKTYTFSLRDANWNNGMPITAKDFVYSWKSVLDPNFPSNNAFQLYAIKNAKLAKEGKVSTEEVGVFAKDDKTLVVELENPTPFFLKLITHPVFFAISSETEMKKPNWIEDTSHIPCSGPFSIQGWKAQDLIQLTKNASYWDFGVVKMDGIELTMVPKEDTELLMYEKGELDWAGSPLSILPIETLGELQGKKKLHAAPFLATCFLRVNIEKKPFDHPDIRRAFALAIARDDIVQHALRGSQTAALSLVPPSLNLKRSSVLQDGDLEQAQALFKKACEERGYTKETFPQIVYTYVAGERNQLIAQSIQQQWLKAFGVEVKLEAIEQKVNYSKLSKQDYQLASGSWVADFEDALNFLDIFKYKSASTNNTNWENETYISLLDQSSKTIDPEKRSELLSQAEEVLMTDLPIIPIFYFTMLYVKNDQIQNVVLSSLGCLDFKWADIEEKQIVVTEK